MKLSDSKLSDSTLRVMVTSVWMAGGLFIFWLSATMTNPIGQPIGPGYVPSLVAMCMVVACTWNLFVDIRKLLRDKKKQAARPDLKPAGKDRKAGGELRVLSLSVLAFACVFIWKSAGYIIGMSLATCALVLIDRKIGIKWALPFSVLVALVMWLIFSVAMQTDLG